MLTVLLFLMLPLVLALNFQNNDCKVLMDYRYAFFSTRCYYNPNVLSSLPEMVRNYGYGIQTYSYTTSDGYILEIFHVFKPNSTMHRGPVFILHGIAANSAPWVSIGNRSLAFVLIDRGYDVWLGNIRGTTYANKHIQLTVNNPEYWNFNIDTVAAIDIPEQLKFVYNKTGKKCLYVAHSMGTTAGLMYASRSSQEAGQLLQGMVLMAPIVYLDGSLFLEVTAPAVLALIDILNVFQIKGLLYHETSIHTFLVNFCKYGPEICYVIINVVGGRTNLKNEDLPLFLTSWPSATSIFQLQQYLQIVRSKRFQKFDYGSLKNLKMYGTRKPPAYNLSGVHLPVCLLYGQTDIFYNKENLERLYNELGTNRKSKHSATPEGRSEKFAHTDFEFPSEKYPYSDWLIANCL